MKRTGALDQEVKAFLEEICKREGWESTDESFTELLLDGDEIHYEMGASHRWYDEKTVVIKIGESFIMYDWYHITGDNSVSDMDLAFDLSSVCFCEPYEETVTRYRMK